MRDAREGLGGGQAGTEASVGEGKTGVRGVEDMRRDSGRALGKSVQVSGAQAHSPLTQRRWRGLELWDEGLITGVSPDGLSRAHRNGHAPPFWRRSMRNCTSTVSL